MNVEQQGTTGIGGVGQVAAPVGEIPQQPGVDRAEGQLTGLRRRARTVHMIEYPADLAGGKIGVEQQTSLVLQDVAATFVLQPFGNLLAPSTGAPVLPYDGPVDGLAGASIPQQGGFALIGNADGADVACLQSGFV